MISAAYLFGHTLLEVGPTAIRALSPMLQRQEPGRACCRMHANLFDDGPLLLVVRDDSMGEFFPLVKLVEPVSSLSRSPATACLLALFLARGQFHQGGNHVFDYLVLWFHDRVLGLVVWF